MSAVSLRAAGTITALALAATGFAGCGTTMLNTDKAETEITKGLDAQVGTGAKVSCPDDVEIKKGDTFNCTATDPEGNEATIVVTQKDDEGNVAWKLK
ncbi:MAG: DUF4333 domain-containing protein [Solirubrobacteraceae bacterium]|nr:DUF4333 domain-containing protein [Solirubrobacteraceae bacterium]